MIKCCLKLLMVSAAIYALPAWSQPTQAAAHGPEKQTNEQRETKASQNEIPVNRVVQQREPAAQSTAASTVTLYAKCTNAIRHYRVPDKNFGDFPDQLTPNSSNYVENYRQADVDFGFDSRTFLEFDLQQCPTPLRAEFHFSVFRYNAPNVTDQLIQVYGYKGIGAISLEDWQAESIYVGSTGPIAGFSNDKKNRGELVGVFSMDITTLLQKALSAGYTHLGFYMMNPKLATIDPRDPLGYSALLTVGNFTITLTTPASSNKNGSDEDQALSKSRDAL